MKYVYKVYDAFGHLEHEYYSTYKKARTRVDVIMKDFEYTIESEEKRFWSTSVHLNETSSYIMIDRISVN